MESEIVTIKAFYREMTSPEAEHEVWVLFSGVDTAILEIMGKLKLSTSALPLEQS